MVEARGAARARKPLPRSLKTAVTTAIGAAREAGRVDCADEALAVLAIKLAAQFEAAVKDDDVRSGELVRLGREIRAVMAALPLREAENGGEGDKPGGIAAGVDAELADIVGGGPTMGDSPHP